MSVKRYKASDLEKMTKADLNAMSNAELRRAYSDIRSVTRKRITNLYTKGLTDIPAYRSLAQRGGLTPTLKGIKDKDILINYYIIARNFLRMQTSTVKGADKFLKKISQAVDPSLNRQQVLDLLSVYDELKQRNPNIGLNYQETQSDLNEILNKEKISPQDIEKISERLTDKEKERYESESKKGKFTAVH